MIRRILVVLAASATVVLAAPAAHAAPPQPFGHACTPQDGVLFCPTADDAPARAELGRCPARRGRDAPADRRRPLPDDRDDARLGRRQDAASRRTRPARSGYNNVYYAQQGYAVVTYTARGWGRSCGALDSRTSPACDRGWIHLADQRYEERDTQHLLGLLVDQGVDEAVGDRRDGRLVRRHPDAQPGAAAQPRAPPGRLVRPWRSPNGHAAARSRPATRAGRRSDMTYALQPNGRFTRLQDAAAERRDPPGGVNKKSYNDGLYAPRRSSAASTSLRAGRSTPTSRPGRCSPTAASRSAGTRSRSGRELTGFHSWVGLSGASAP